MQKYDVINSKISFISFLKTNEEVLMEKILSYAKKFGYTKYTSTLLEAWRVSIEGLSDSLELLMGEVKSFPEFHPDCHYDEDPASAFGVLEAQRHRKRGVNYAMFISLFKYYRDSYIDLIEEHKERFSEEDFVYFIKFTTKFFDRVEIAYSIEWSGRSSEEQILELSQQNRAVVNEKNLYLTVFDSFSDGAIIVDTEHKIKNYNQAAAKIVFDKEEPSGTYYYSEQKEAQLPPWLQEEIQSLGTQKSKSTKKTLLQEHTKKILSIKISRLLDISEKYSGCIVIVEDITHEEILRERFELAIEGAQEGVWDWDVQTDEVYFSPRWKEMLGYRDDEIQNSIESWEALVHPDDLESAKADIYKSLQKPNLFYENIHRLRHKEGHYIWNLDRGWTLFEDDKPVRMVGSHTDITKIKELEEKNRALQTNEVNLKENVQRLAQIVESAQIEMYIFDAQNLKFLYANRAALEHVGYTSEEIFDKTPFEIKNLPQKEFVKKLKPLEDANTKSIEFEALHNRKDGSSYPVNAIVQKTKFWSKDAYLAIIYDTSEHKKMLQSLQATQELMLAQSRHAAMGEMIGMIAHQWRQPISAISMIVNNMLVDVELSGINENECLSGGKNILNQVEYLSKTIDDFRDFFRPNKEKESVQIIDIAKEVQTVIGASFVHHNIAFEIQNFSNKEVKTFPRELLQVFMNILKNAKEAFETKRQEEKKVVLKIYDEDNSVVTEICDNAGGIKNEILPRIFEPYFSTKDQKNRHWAWALYK